MRLHEISMVDAPHYKGQSQNPETVPDNAFELRIADQKKNIDGWQKIYDKLPDKEEPYAYQVKFRIEDMERELADLEEIGELPFTFYAAVNRDTAEWFSDQFVDGEVREVRVTAKNLATDADLRALGFPKRTVSHITPIMVHKLKKAGFDGATGIIDLPHAGGDEVVVFSREQVKVL